MKRYLNPIRYDKESARAALKERVFTAGTWVCISFITGFILTILILRSLL